jgi:DNA-binding transcriptional LysR family regulator
LLLREAEEILQRASVIVEKMTGTVDDPVGILRIGASTTIGNYLLPAIVGRFSRRHRRAGIELVVANTNQIEEKLGAGYLDIGFIEGPSHQGNLINTDWCDDELVVIASPRHAWAKKGAVSLRELKKAPWLAREPGSGTREVFERAMIEVGLKAEVKIELGHTEAIKNGVTGNLGVACLSRLAVAKEIAHGWLAEIKTPLRLQRKLSVIQRHTASSTPLFKAMLKFVFAPENRLVLPFS